MQRTFKEPNKMKDLFLYNGQKWTTNLAYFLKTESNIVRDKIVSQYDEQKQGVLNSNTIIVGYFNIPVQK